MFPRAMAVAARFGLPRLLRACFPSLRAQLPFVRPHEFAAAEDDLASLERVKPPLSEPGGFGTLGDLPLIVIEHGQPFPGPFRLLEKHWAAGQGRLAALSTKGELIRAQKSNHMIHLDQPDLVVDAIQRVHASARAAVSLAADRLQWHPAEPTAPPRSSGTFPYSPIVTVMAEDRKSTRLNSSHRSLSRMPSSA